MKAQEQGIAGKSATGAELHELVTKTIRGAREATHLLMREGLIPPAKASG